MENILMPQKFISDTSYPSLFPFPLASIKDHTKKKKWQEQGDYKYVSIAFCFVLFLTRKGPVYQTLITHLGSFILLQVENCFLCILFHTYMFSTRSYTSYILHYSRFNVLHIIDTHQVPIHCSQKPQDIKLLDKRKQLRARGRLVYSQDLLIL